MLLLTRRRLVRRQALGTAYGGRRRRFGRISSSAYGRDCGWRCRHPPLRSCALSRRTRKQRRISPGRNSVQRVFVRRRDDTWLCLGRPRPWSQLVPFTCSSRAPFVQLKLPTRRRRRGRRERRRARRGSHAALRGRAEPRRIPAASRQHAGLPPRRSRRLWRPRTAQHIAPTPAAARTSPVTLVNKKRRRLLRCQSLRGAAQRRGRQRSRRSALAPPARSLNSSRTCTSPSTTASTTVATAVQAWLHSTS